FAAVRIVVEDRHSVVGAIAAAIRFVRRRIGRVVLLLLFNGLAMLAVLRLLLQFELHEPYSPGWNQLIVFGWLLVAIGARLAMWSSEIAFFQGELAHAGYTARPLPAWPDSAAVEAMENLTRGIRG